MSSILYLDFDGVLHPEGVFVNHEGRIYLSDEYRSRGHRLFESCDHLVEVLRPYPSIEIVLSTTWARVFGYERAAQCLPPELSRRVVGGTYDLTTSIAAFDSLPRGKQVAADAEHRRCASWLALDDDAYKWPIEHLPNLLQTKPAWGLQDPGTREQLERGLSTLVSGVQRRC